MLPGVEPDLILRVTWWNYHGSIDMRLVYNVYTATFNAIEFAQGISDGTLGYSERGWVLRSLRASEGLSSMSPCDGLWWVVGKTIIEFTWCFFKMVWCDKVHNSNGSRLRGKDCWRQKGVPVKTYSAKKARAWMEKITVSDGLLEPSMKWMENASQAAHQGLKILWRSCKWVNITRRIWRHERAKQVLGWYSWAMSDHVDRAWL